MVRSSWFASIAFAATVLALSMLASSRAPAQALDHAKKDDRPGPVYQRRAFESFPKHDRRRHPQQRVQFAAPPVSSGWFQRPYPYHLDYYRMKYGGSYEPYFGNLYGPPQVVTAPPYYGPYYGGYGYPAPYGADAAYNGPPILYPNYQPGDDQPPTEEANPRPRSSGERLPLPVR